MYFTVIFQAGKYCYCGDDYKKYGRAECNVTCSGDKDEICGDTEKITVHSGWFFYIYFCTPS